MRFRVEGMHCAHCVRAVQQAVVSVAPDASPEVDLGAGIVTLHGNPDPARVAAAIADEGYKAIVIDG